MPNKNRLKSWANVVLYSSILGIAVLLLGRVDSLTSMNTSDVVTFYTAAGAMVGGILAIIFSLSSLLMGNAAERIPVGFYETAAKDWAHDTIFFLISGCSIILFASALLFGKLHWGVATYSFQVALLIVGFVFYLIFVFYRRVLRRVNPANVLKIAKEQALDRLSRAHKQARETAHVLTLRPSSGKDNNGVSAGLALAGAFHHPHFHVEFSDINSRLRYLFDYHGKLVNSQERSSALRVLEDIQEILQKYFEIRKESSLILPSGFLFATTSDSGDFLTPNLEGLKAVGEEYMRNHDDVGVAKVIKVFADLCVSAGEIQYVTGHQTDNPILAQCRGYLDQLVDSAVKINSLEALFQCAVAYERIGSLVVQHDLQHEFTPIYGVLDKIAISGFTNNFTVVSEEVLKTYTSIMSEMVLEKIFFLEIKLKALLEHLANIIFLLFQAVKAGTLRGNMFTQTGLSLPFRTLVSLSRSVATLVEEPCSEDERKEWKSTLLVVAGELRSTLRNLSEKLKTADHLLVNTFGGVIEDVSVLLLDLTQNDRWREERERLIRLVGWYVHQLSWFTYEVERIESNLAFDSLVEAATKIGIKALEVDQEQLASEAINVIAKFANDMFAKEKGNKYGFTEPRIMERACYIGILALKEGKRAVVGDLKQRVRSFEVAYTRYWFPEVSEGMEPTSPTRDQLFQELLRLLDESRRVYPLHRGVMGHSKDVLLVLVTPEDIRSFIREIWGVAAERL